MTQPEAADLPTMREYLAGLPDGLDSYPQCLAKASLYRTVLETGRRDDPLFEHLPAPLRELALHPPPVTAWIPEVHSHAILLAMHDGWFESRQAYLRHAYAMQRDLFKSPLYAILLRVATPQLLIRGASLRWRAFHRGTEIRARMVASATAAIELVTPPQLWDPVATLALAEGLRALLDLCGTRDAEVLARTRADGHVEFTASWR